MYTSPTSSTNKENETEPPKMETDGAPDPSEQWIDIHSVTCALCGDLADERETIKLYEQDTDHEGEAHQNCWENLKDDDTTKDEDNS